MTTDGLVLGLVRYALEKGLIEEADRIWAANRLLEVLGLDSLDPAAEPEAAELPVLLEGLCEDARKRGVLEEGITASDLFDTRLMGALTPPPREVRRTFSSLYGQDPEKATEWFYRFCGDTNYIRRERIARDLKWNHDCEYGTLVITVNLSKPEKDPKDIAAALKADPSKRKYPACQLCGENEGYAGRRDHPARQNHRVIPFTLDGTPWFFQYSPYVYYNEHCIVFSEQHVPMKIDGHCFRCLLDFVRQMPHYFVGSNSDLPIVGGSILSHEHFQGGRYVFPMETSPVEVPVSFGGYADVEAGIVRWPLSVIRLRCADAERLSLLAEKILSVWRGWTDEAAAIFAETEGVRHNTITPIARKRDGKFELDLVLRNNLTTPDRTDGLYHAAPEFHHIKKEGIGLIEVMGLAVLPARLRKELAGVKQALLEGKDLREDPVLAKHADWAEQLKSRHSFTPENADRILEQEVGEVFRRILENCGVYKRTPEGRAAFLRFIDGVNRL